MPTRSPPLLRLSSIFSHFYSTSNHNMSKNSQLRETISKSLADFASSNDSFKIIKTIPSNSSPLPLTKPHTIYVVDSSFNPPHYAHATLVRKAVQAHNQDIPVRICLLLATQNADKKPKPAVFEDRLVMMSLMGESLLNSLSTSTDSEELAVDVAVTKEPFFMDKAASMDESGLYGPSQQVHCTGYDTIIRIFDRKYYGEQGFSVLEPFLTRHKLRVSYRVGEGVEGGGDRAEQDQYVARIRDGSRASEGVDQKWASAIQLVDDADSVKGVSSTKARNAAIAGDREALVKLVGDSVADYVVQMKLYETT